MAETQDITVEVDGPVAIVRLDRPARRNAYTPRMGAELTEELVRLDALPEVRAIVVTGAGEHFGVGADLDQVDWRDREAHDVESLREPEKAPWNLSTPIIAAINGDAIGVSLTWAMQWDIRVVADTARLAFSFNRIGIIPDRNSTWLLPRLVGFSTAMDLLLTGRTITGTEGHRLGLASRCVPAADVLTEAVSVAHDLAERCAPASVTATKRLMYEFLEETDRLRAYNYERRTLNWIRTLGETLRGIAAFKTRRPPEWGTTKHVTIPADLR
ncbi:enoyl-CoA hydratase/isomerase family protein [Actinophytocola oryzae]|uniref:Enoyl-CoA hydratase/carnithine racemase n=1 Tax=Actinophytocola oryzae TaxID=502181 RepID=A0A4R7W206_9PSEU|nr:enoyl-CoA hydratase-related protein [Actinophytocola oryzae]TDV56524.1 enoyl-CoA hydratase/carnithine racemase [Actinophytocola oryzae]